MDLITSRAMAVEVDFVGDGLRRHEHDVRSEQHDEEQVTDEFEEEESPSRVIVDWTKESTRTTTALDVDGVGCGGATGRDTSSVSPSPLTSQPHRLHFLTHCGTVWAGCLRDKARHCWTMFTKRKKGQFFFSYYFFSCSILLLFHIFLLFLKFKMSG